MPARSIRLIGAMLLVAGCHSSSGPLTTHELSDLVRAQQKWQARGFGDYVFEMRLDCFCDRESNEWSVVDVRNGQISHVRTLDGVEIPPARWGARAPIEQLFLLVTKKQDAWVANVDAEFDPTLGFPVTIALVSKPNIADAGVVYHVRNARALQ